MADGAANASDVNFVSYSSQNLRRLLQVKGINDTDYFAALANLSFAFM